MNFPNFSPSIARLRGAKFMYGIGRVSSACLHSTSQDMLKSNSPKIIAKPKILVGGVPQELSDAALLTAVEQSGDDCQVTVQIEVEEDLKNTRLDSFLSNSISILSRSALARLIRAEGVTVNGRLPKPASKLKAGDQVVVNLPPPPSSDVLGEDIPLHILMEDDQVIVVNKQVALSYLFFAVSHFLSRFEYFA
jgi:hypothetical protein